MNLTSSETCPYCKTEMSSLSIVCDNCDRVKFPASGDNLTLFNVFMIIFGYFFIYFIFGVLSGFLSNTINHGGIFSPWDMGMISLGIISGKYFLRKKSYYPFLWMLLGGITGGVIAVIINSYFKGYYYLNIIIDIIIGASFGGTFGLATKYSKNNEIKKVIFFTLAGIIGGITASTINGILIDIIIIEDLAWHLNIFSNIMLGIQTGIIFALCFFIASKFVYYKESFINIIYATSGALICGGILGGIVDAINFNPFWSGLFEVQENIFLSIRMGFARDGIICGLVAFGIVFMNALVYKTNRIQTYIFTVLGGILGGAIAVNVILSASVDFISYSAIEKSFYNIASTYNFKGISWTAVGGLFGGGISLGIVTVRDIFMKNNLSNFKKMILQAAGGFSGGIFAGIFIGILISLESRIIVNTKLTLSIIFLLCIISAMYGALISLGMNLSRFNPIAITPMGITNILDNTGNN
ncbi:MAG: hypothetical protein HY934_00130 [Candidatus Firestonebacteria bacterium]|nr:hypothetical protein [Candidatus Firestonebacteria bacterium]